MSDINEQEFLEAERIYLEFFDITPKYQERIKSLISKNGRRLIIDLNDLRSTNDDRVQKLMSNSFVEIGACQKALKRCIENIDQDYSKKFDEFFVGFEGSFGGRHLNPRSLSSDFLSNMVCIDGIVTKVSNIKTKIVHSVHYCPATKKSLERFYTDATSINPYPSSGAYPIQDEEGNRLETEFGLSTYKDTQSISIQEMPENAPAGQLSRSINIILEHDLVDSCKAGDRIYVSGQFRCLPGKTGGFTTATFPAILIANNVYPFAQKSSTGFENSDLLTIRRLAKQSNIVDILTRSIAPSLCGHEFIKRAILCQLLGGVERILINGTRIRGDINVLLLGDPSTGKSQLLRFVLQCARDRAIATTGRGSTGVGLTAAVVTDRESGDRGLVPGAMVLADRGIVCIDEFDKMSDIDRTAIHEVMEQGRVTISKAGIHARLNARCSVLAAANPVYGRYDQYKTPTENIGLQDSLLSRFDLLFVVLDQCDEELDRNLTDFIGRVYMYREPGEECGSAMPLQTSSRIDYVNTQEVASGTDKNDTKTATDTPIIKNDPIYEEPSKNLYGSGRKDKHFTVKFLQKYIHMARQMQPKLTTEASQLLSEKYCDLRDLESERISNESNQYRTQPVTARTMETLIRIATAHAKARLSKIVTVRDAEDAIDLMSFALFKEVLKKSHKRSRVEYDGVDIDEEIGDLTIGGATKKMRSDGMDICDDNDNDDDNKENDPAVQETIALSESDMTQLIKELSEIFHKTHNTSMLIAELVNRMDEAHPNKYDSSQIRHCLVHLNDTNRIMLTEDEVYLL